ncbi:MAG: transposase [Trichodesmium sp. St15_bin1_1]|jgi:transposase|nr:transposase [Trichodesmium sp. St16_bin2-tuft]MDE5107191.1 transposase [Trichodesmium sp. St17_bin3_1_1]MDE5115655.1 transposase [Trichodesmium sp. St15_bin1_1]MDE5121806.1 transposase [Trichodesmium sp. St19_bin1]
MPKVYSLDLRKKVFSAWQAGEGSQRELAKRFNVSLSFVRDLSRRYRETGTIVPKLQGGDRRSKLQEKEQKIVEKIIESKNDISLREIKELLQNQTGIVVSLSTLCRTLQKWELRYKKKPLLPVTKIVKE